MLKALMNNFRKPSGVIGSLFCWAMNVGHRPFVRDVFKHITITPGMRTLDIGCGGGDVLHMMLERGADATGVDYSATSVSKTLSRVAKYVECGKAKVYCASVQALPDGDKSFDLITAFATVYFWPEIENSFKEVFRALRPGGRFIAAQKAWKEGDEINCPVFFLQNLEMTLYSPDELESVLLSAGFATVGTIRAQNNKWIAVYGEKKPEAE